MRRRLIRRSTVDVVLLLAVSACSSDGRTVLVVYSPHGKELLAHYEAAFEKARPDIDVQWVDMGSQEVLDRLRAEKANPQADVWFGAPDEIFARAAGEGLLEPYTPTWAAAVPATARDPAGRWFGTYLTPEVIAYNAEVVSAAEAPKDWDDVLDPRWKGRIIIRDPIASGSMRAIYGGLIAREAKRTGSVDAGFEWLKRLDASTREYVLNPTILYQKLGRREGVITLYNMPDIATLRSRFNIPVDYVIPASGTPIIVDAVAIVKGTARSEAARAYYEFVTTREAIIEAAHRFLRIPVRTDIPGDSLPQWIRDANARLRPLDVDRAFLAAHLDEWMRRWDATIRNQYRGK